MINPKFQITEENQRKLTTPELKFIFEQADKLLKQTVDTSNTVVTRTAILLTVAVGILTSVLGFLLNQCQSTYFGPLEITGVVISIYLFGWLLFTVGNINGKKYLDMGTHPKDLVHDHFVNEYPNNAKARTAYYYLTQIDFYQERIDRNMALNIKRWRRFSISLYGIVLTPALTALLYLTISLLS